MKIVVLDGYSLNPGDLSWKGLEEFGDATVYDRTAPSDILKNIGGAEAIFTNKTPLDAHTIERMKNVRYIGVLATGYNIVDVEAAGSRGITVTNVPGYGTSAVAQFTMALLLELCHHIGEHGAAVRAGEWTRSVDFTFHNHPLIELEGKTMGIIGMGSIGMAVARLARAFGMNVVYYGRNRKKPAEFRGFAYKELDELLSISDVVSLHCPLTDETRGMIDSVAIGLMKPTALLINTSRGPVVNEKDLAEALNRGTIAGAAVDVLSKEPPDADNPLIAAANCMVTPHIAWAAFEARRRLMDAAIDNFRSFIKGNPVNKVN
ncbi:MAG: D-2-hydroxyacid dehydrogenase [Clostridia bacterium]|nr:D-2-hydroxyacid dehydrogenase [Clostridia bacterium]